MCGITGIFNLNGEPVSPVVLRNMTDAIAHRGPDSEGFFIDSFIGLGHRRLSIIDLSPAGHQPMVTPGLDTILIYNGEIYNYLELRAELEAKGYRFRSRTDSEVVLYAYKEWASACLTRFNGMFAFAVWDKNRQQLFLARDRYGIKPLYYAQLGSTILFSSEVKSFLQHPGFRVDVSLPHLLEYFTFQNIFTDGTLFKGVKLLPPGHYLTVSLGTSQIQRFQYWDFAFTEPEQVLADNEYEDRLAHLFKQAVQRQLISDVPVGAYLSGGMDSGSITAIAAKALPYMSTFTGGFDLTSASGIELGFDEREKAEALSYLFKTEHYEVVLKAGDMERCMDTLTWHLEDPRVGQSYPNYYVARLASKFVKVILTGTGGDELFAGYPWRYYRAIEDGGQHDYIGAYYRYWHRLVPDLYMKELFLPEVWSKIKDIRTADIFRAVLNGHLNPPKNPVDYVNQSLYFEAKTFLHGLLMVEDKLSMAHSLESRVPFLDNDLVEFAQNIPMHLKLQKLDQVERFNENEPGSKKQKYFEKTRDGKILMRRVMSRYVPDSITNQIKQGFSGPDATWFRGESINYILDIINNERSRMYDFFNPRTIKKLVAEHSSGQVNRRLFIWSLLNFEWWLLKFQ